MAAAIPYFPLHEGEAAEFEIEYENNPNLWGNAPLKERPQYKWGEWGHPDPAEQAGGSEYESENEYEAPEVEAGGDSSGEAGAAATGGAIETPGGSSGAVAAAPDAGVGAMAGAGAAGPAAGGAAAAAAPVVVDETQAGGNSAVHAAAGPVPGQLQAGNSRGKGLGIAVGLCLLVVATTAVAVFAIRKYWRHR